MPPFDDNDFEPALDSASPAAPQDQSTQTATNPPGHDWPAAVLGAAPQPQTQLGLATDYWRNQGLDARTTNPGGDHLVFDLKQLWNRIYGAPITPGQYLSQAPGNPPEVDAATEPGESGSTGGIRYLVQPEADDRPKAMQNKGGFAPNRYETHVNEMKADIAKQRAEDAFHSRYPNLGLYQGQTRTDYINYEDRRAGVDYWPPAQIAAGLLTGVMGLGAGPLESLSGGYPRLDPRLSGVTVLGPNPSYVTEARQMGANYLSTKNWSEPLNHAFIDDAMARNHTFKFSTPISEIDPITETQNEANQILGSEKGYKQVDDYTMRRGK